jgi:hypothetical protein
MHRMVLSRPYSPVARTAAAGLATKIIRQAWKSRRQWARAFDGSQGPPGLLFCMTAKIPTTNPREQGLLATLSCVRRLAATLQ